MTTTTLEPTELELWMLWVEDQERKLLCPGMIEELPEDFEEIRVEHIEIHSR